MYIALYLLLVPAGAVIWLLARSGLRWPGTPAEVIAWMAAI